MGWLGRRAEAVPAWLLGRPACHNPGRSTHATEAGHTAPHSDEACTGAQPSQLGPSIPHGWAALRLLHSLSVLGRGRCWMFSPSAEPTPAAISTASGNHRSLYHIPTQSLGKALLVFPMCQGCNELAEQAAGQSHLRCTAQRDMSEQPAFNTHPHPPGTPDDCSQAGRSGNGWKVTETSLALHSQRSGDLPQIGMRGTTNRQPLNYDSCSRDCHQAQMDICRGASGLRWESPSWSPADGGKGASHRLGQYPHPCSSPRCQVYVPNSGPLMPEEMV